MMIYAIGACVLIFLFLIGIIYMLSVSRGSDKWIIKTNKIWSKDAKNEQRQFNKNMERPIDLALKRLRKNSSSSL